jgi:hypothetical protein
MRKYKITLARIEIAEPNSANGEVRLTFQIDRSPLSFQVPIILNMRDFDDTEMVEAARDALHSTFAELTAQTENWRLTAKDLQKLSNISLRPNPKKRPA